MKVKCDSCKKEFEVLDNVIMIMCGCGYCAYERKEEKEEVDDAR